MKIVLAALALAGCAHGTIGAMPLVPDPERTAAFIVVRPYHFVASGTAITVTVDGAEVCELGIDEHVVIRVPEGERIVGLKTWSSSVLFTRAYPTQVVEAQQGRTYYFRIGPHDMINRITEEAGRDLMSKTTLLTPAASGPR